MLLQPLFVAVMGAMMSKGLRRNGVGPATPTIAYVLANRPHALSVPEGMVINVSDLPIGNRQRNIAGNWVTLDRPVLVSTDWWTDSDDVVATRIMIQQERLGLINIQGVAFDATLAKGPGSFEAFCIADGRPGIELAACDPVHVPDGTPSYQNRLFQMPHTVGGPETLEKAVSLFRRKLAQATGKIDIIAIGYMNNLSDLLASGPDAHSPLTGVELVSQKVNILWAMAGSWPTGSENNFTRTPISRQAGATLCSTWPTPIVFLGWSVANNLISGGNLAGSDENGGYLHMALTDHGFPNGRSSWDPMTMLLATVGNTGADGIDLRPNGFATIRGTATVDPATGNNTWVNSDTGKHYYVVKEQSDTYFRNAMNSFLIKSAPPAETPIVQYIEPSNVFTDEINLFEAWDADAVSQGLTMKVPSWTGRKGLVASQADATKQPVMAVAADGKRALLFTDNCLITPVVTPSVNMTAYALVRWESTYNQIAQSFITSDQGSRNWHLKSAGNTVMGASFNGGTGYTDTVAIEAFTPGQWYVLAFTRSATELMAYIDGTTDGVGKTLPGTNTAAVSICIGARGGAAEFVKNAHVRSLRIYKATHDAATVAAISREMRQ